MEQSISPTPTVWDKLIERLFLFDFWFSLDLVGNWSDWINCDFLMSIWTDWWVFAMVKAMGVVVFVYSRWDERVVCAWGFVLLGQGCGGGGVGFSTADRVGVVVLYLGELFCGCASEPFFFFLIKKKHYKLGNIKCVLFEPCTCENY